MVALFLLAKRKIITREVSETVSMVSIIAVKYSMILPQVQ